MSLWNYLKMPMELAEKQKKKGASEKMNTNTTRGKIGAGVFLIVLLSCAVTGCGRKSIDVMEEIRERMVLQP